MTIKDLDDIPKKPGVYLWKNEFGHILYVGKAKNLFNRMRQYFKGSINSYKTHKLVQNIFSYEFIICHNDKEALILERNLIEKHKPPFNILLIDDKRYPYIKISLTKNDLDIRILRRYKKEKNSLYYGPFPNGYGSRVIMNLLIRETKFEQGLPIENTSQDFWLKQFNLIKEILSNNNSKYIHDLKSKMLLAADHLQFEIANDFKEAIKYLEELKTKQVVELNKNINIDVIGYSVDEKNDYCFISMMFYRYGSLLFVESETLEINIDAQETIREFTNEYYKNHFIPDEIILPFDFESSDFDLQSKIIFPQKGIYKQILEQANLNAQNKMEYKILEFIKRKDLSQNNVSKICELLNIPAANNMIMIDNSNSNNYQPVSAIISIKNGFFSKNDYKKYNLVTNEDRKSDVEYMRQVATRFFLNENNIIPDLVFVDGGLAQVREVKKVINSLGLLVNIVGLVKNDKHTTNHLINLQEQEVQIKDKDLLLFFRNIQEEVDRFAKMHHRVLRTKNTLNSFLLSIKGIGPSGEKKLLAKFQTYSAIYNASIEELSSIISHASALELKEKLKENS